MSDPEGTHPPTVAPDARPMLRHLTASLAFRTTVVLRDAPPSLATFEPPEGARTPTALLRHVSDLTERAAVRVAGDGAALAPRPETEADADDDPVRIWAGETERVYLAFAALDAAWSDDDAWGRLDAKTCHALIQGPLLDVAAHVGQLALLRRLAGSPVPEVRYPSAPIRIGRFGKDQPLS